MLFNYRVANQEGQEQAGSIDAPNMDLAITALQKRGLVVLSINPESEPPWWQKQIPLFNRVQTRDIVILSRQISTLFEAKVSVLASFRLLAGDVSNPALREALISVTDDIKSGVSISNALAKHPKVFSNFYVNMVKSGEESGKLSETFSYLADHLERAYALTSKAKNALIYPAFIICTFAIVMILMMTFVVPQLSEMLLETGQELPVYTMAVMAVSDFFVTYGIVVLALLILGGIYLMKYLKTPDGRRLLSQAQLYIPYVGRLYKKLYLARIADNLNTLTTSGVAVVRSIEITAEIVDNYVYKKILEDTAESVRGGSSVSDVFAKYDEMPGIMVQMVKVGEESGRMGYILDTLSGFYHREVEDQVNTLVGMIEPVMILMLGLFVGILLVSVLMPIYNIAGSF